MRIFVLVHALFVGFKDANLEFDEQLKVLIVQCYNAQLNRSTTDSGFTNVNHRTNKKHGSSSLLCLH